MFKTITSPVNAVESKSSYLWIDDEGVLIIVHKPLATQELKDALENIALIKQLLQGKPRPILADMSAVKSMTREAREEYARAGDDSAATAIGMITRSPMGRIVANFFLTFNKPAVPTRLFSNYVAAKKWLMTFK